MSSQTIKNRFTLAVYVMRVINERVTAIRAIAVGLIAQIDQELAVRIE